MPKRKWKVFIVDDHPLLRRGYAYLIEREPDLQICGEAESVAEALERIPSARPDLVVTDITLEGASGLELIRSLQKFDSKLPILVVSMHDESMYAWRCFRGGAKGYVVKRKAEATIIEAIRCLVGGGFFLSDQMMQSIMQDFQGRTNGLDSDPLEALTDRELDIFHRLGQGMSTREIGDSLHISIKTVSSHQLRIRNKLGVASSRDLVHRAKQWIQERSSRSAVK